MNFRLVVLVFYFFLSYQLYATQAKKDASLKHPLSWKLPCESVAWLKGCNAETINQQNFFGYTKLHVAVGATGTRDCIFKTYPQETVSIINYLLVNNADPNVCNDNGDSPFFYLITKSFDSDHLVSLFLEHKADLNKYDRERTVLHYCDSKPMDIKRLRLLLDHTANPCLTVKKNVHSAPHLNLVDGQYPYEATEDREKQNLLLHAIPWWFLGKKREAVMIFLLYMNVCKKNERIVWPPRFVQYEILGIASLVRAFKKIEDIKGKETLDENEKVDIKNMIDLLIKDYDAK